MTVVGGVLRRWDLTASQGVLTMAGVKRCRVYMATLDAESFALLEIPARLWLQYSRWEAEAALRGSAVRSEIHDWLLEVS